MGNSVRMTGHAERQLILATLRMDAARDDAIRIAAEQPLDWTLVQSLAQLHGVLPLVYTRLKEAAAAFVPTDVMREMADAQSANDMRVFQMTIDLIKVVRALESAGITVLTLKGPTLAAHLYGKASLRSFGDLDILVPQADYPRAEKVLHALGMQPIINETFPTHETTEREFAIERERKFMFPHGLYHVEMHWRITTSEFPRALDPCRLFAQSQQVTVCGQSLRTLGNTDLVLHTCLHGTMHRWTTLRFIAEFAHAFSAIEAECLEILLQTAREQGLMRFMLVGFGLSHDLLGQSIPQDMKRAMKFDLLAVWATQIIRSYLWRGETGKGAIDELMLQLMLKQGERLQLIAKVVASSFTPFERDYQWIHLPASLHWLYPVLRPFRCIWSGIVAIYKWARRNGDMSINEAIATNNRKSEVYLSNSAK